MKLPTCLAQGRARFTSGWASASGQTYPPESSYGIAARCTCWRKACAPYATPSESHYGNAHCLPAAFRQRNREHLHFTLLSCSSGGSLTIILPPHASMLVLFKPRARCNCFCKYLAAVCFVLELVVRLCMHGLLNEGAKLHFVAVKVVVLRSSISHAC